MKPVFKLLTLFVNSLLILWATESHATNYYVSAFGNDSAAGTSTTTPWRTLAKLNDLSFANGDKIFFKRGDVFFGQLRIKNTGVTISAYGNGHNPVISGLEKITTTWTLNNGNVWETSFISGKPSIMNNLIANGINLPISRYPNVSVNHGYLNMENHAGLTQFTDDELPATPNWTGTDVVVRSERWRMVRTTVSSHSGPTITIPSNASIQNLRNGYGYFFVNDVKAIDTEGEWAYKSNTGKVYLYSSIDPNKQNIYFVRIDTLLTVSNSSNVVIKNLDIRYANKLCVFVSNCSNSSLDSLSITFSGGDGVNYANCVRGTFTNCRVSNVNNTGVYATANNRQFLFKNNIISNIGNEAFGKSKSFIGLDINCPDTEVSNNVVSRTGYSGIISAGLNNLVKRNVVDSACLSLEDMGGIYTNFNVGANDGMVIEENIVTNSVGEMLGAPGEYSKANGIYLDNLSRGVTVRNNTVAYIKGAGLFANYIRTGIRIYNNTSYASGVNEFSVYKPMENPNFVFHENILVTNSKNINHNVINSDHTDAFTYADMGVYTGNYVINPFHDTTVIVSFKDNKIPKTQKYTPYDWEAAAPEIRETVSAPIKYSTSVDSATVIRFFYNTTSASKTITLPPGRFIDAKNQAFCGTAVLSPYSSLVLFKVNDDMCTAPSACTQIFAGNMDSLTGNTVKLSWNSTAGNINYDIRYRPEADSIWKYAHNIQDTTIKLLGLLPETYYRCEIRKSCYGSESEWQALPVFRTREAVHSHVFVNADYSICSPSTAFAEVHSDTDNKWTLQNSGGTGTVDKDLMRSSSVSENAPEITLTVSDVLDSCGTYDIYFYYLSPSTQPWKTKARLSTQAAFTTYDRYTPGAELLPDNAGSSSSDRLFRAKLGTVSKASGFSVIIDDINYGASSAKTMFDGVGYIKISDEKPTAPDSLQSVSIREKQISTTWKDNATDETSYVVERKEGSAAFSTIATLPANSTTYVDSISSSSVYTYRVYAQKGSCTSAYSNQLKVDNTEILKVFISKDSGEMPEIYPNAFGRLMGAKVPQK